MIKTIIAYALPIVVAAAGGLIINAVATDQRTFATAIASAAGSGPVGVIGVALFCAGAGFVVYRVVHAFFNRK